MASAAVLAANAAKAASSAVASVGALIAAVTRLWISEVVSASVLATASMPMLALPRLAAVTPVTPASA